MTPQDLGFIRIGRQVFSDPRNRAGHGVWATVYRLDPQGRLPLAGAELMENPTP